MKLWQKIFIGTFLLFELAFHSTSYYFLESTFSQQLNKEIERGLSEQRILHAGLENSGAYIAGKTEVPNEVREDYLETVFREYTRYFDQKGVFLEITDTDNRPVFSSFDKSVIGPRMELEAPFSDKRSYIIRDIGDRSYLFVTSSLVLGEETLKLIYSRDITDIYANKSAQFKLYLQINLAITVVLGSGLYVLLHYLTRSIRSLTDTARLMVVGDYSRRVPVLSGDEIGTLARHFNAMAEAVEDKVEELRRVAENKQHFIECLTHELKTPLTSIIGYADFLLTTRYQEDVYFKGLHHIYIEGKRLESLSFKLMDLILLANEELAGKPEDIHNVCAEIAESLSPRIEGAGLTLHLDYARQKRVMDKDLFKVLCANLLDNAVKASPAGSVITLRGTIDGDSGYVLEVEDEGIGIPREELEKVQQPFYMVDKARSRSHRGAGLGLAICAEIVRLHGGTLALHSVPGQGTKAMVTLPSTGN